MTGLPIVVAVTEYRPASLDGMQRGARTTELLAGPMCGGFW
jgi:hypothetical protein